MKHDKHLRKTFFPAATVPWDPRGRELVQSLAPAPDQSHSGHRNKYQSDGLVADHNLLDELQSLLSRLGAAKIILTLYLVEFGGLPRRLARPLLQEAAGSCAMLRLPALDRHLVIYLKAGAIPGHRRLSGPSAPRPDIPDAAHHGARPAGMRLGRGAQPAPLQP